MVNFFFVYIKVRNKSLISDSFQFQKLFSMYTQKIPIAFLESVLDQEEADPDVKKEFSSENLDSEGEKMKEKIEEKMRAYRDLYFNILD